jgi:hypothetical protein
VAHEPFVGSLGLRVGEEGTGRRFLHLTDHSQNS